MSRYRFGRQGVASQSEKSNTRTFIKAAIVTVILLIPAVIYVIYTTLPPSPVTGKTIDKGFFDPFTTIETDWFSFRVEKTWQEVTELMVKDKVYVYREMQGSNPQGILTIYINSTPAGYEDFFTRMVPVTVKEDGSLMAQDMQPHCDTLTNPVATTNRIVTQADASFMCWAGGRVMYAVASEVGGDTAITMKRTNGETANYMITYRNLAFTENDTTMTRVLNTFKSQ